MSTDVKTDSDAVSDNLYAPLHEDDTSIKHLTTACAISPLPLVAGGLLSKHHEEYQYLDAVRTIIESGNVKLDRTGTGTLSKFGMQFRYSLADGKFPLFTTKRVFFRGVVEELLWFIRGSTNAKELSAKGIKIWDANGSRQFLDSSNLSHREEGDLGPVYGFQWRRFGAKYENMHADYSGKGVDQLQQVIDRLRKNPNDRRAIVCAWNAADLPEMALPPCHVMFQFYVADGRKLSCQMYQRSADMGLGVPFNVASYALLTCLVARVLDLEPYEFIHTLGDAHVYRDHVEPLQVQLQREPRPFPTLKVRTPKSAAGDKLLSIDDFVAEDIELLNYSPHPAISMKMSA